ncbi:hypothetical protein K1T71_006615 [Dendrolimus kikuchii]|uniref:Uncharacterized protein n=1 Tax=Dendrolimus kikuchii TaxID=765133 RepID=A0ACC1D2X5_9NEOP|nr:hypothetical protein K1T71_006615 [Dendrolimus kikuchii]
MFHNMLVTGVTPLENKNELQNWENRPFIDSWPEDSTQKSKETKRSPIKKKPKRLRTAYTTEQIKVLERTFIKTRYLDTVRRKELAKSLNISERCIKVWFQNRRMKEKKESSESSCDSSSEVTASGQSTTSSICVSNDNDQYEPSQYDMHHVPYYELPNWYSSDNIQNSVGLYQNMPMSNAPNSLFYNDNNVYPTQYYPSLGVEYLNDYTNNSFNQYGQYSSEMYGNWPNQIQPNNYYFP